MPKIKITALRAGIGNRWHQRDELVDVDDDTAKRLVALDSAEIVSGRPRKAASDKEQD